MGHWTQKYFGKLYHEIYSTQILDEQRALDEASFAAHVLDLGRRSVLDLACGYGRHARLLASSNKVFAVDNNRSYLAEARQGAPERIIKNLYPVQADMRSIPLASGRVDAVISLFNSFGYFDSADDGADAASARAELGASGQVWKLPNVFYERQLVDPQFGRFKDPDETAVSSSAVTSEKEQPAREETENVQVLREVLRVLKPGGGFLLEVPNPRPLLDAVEENPRRLMVMDEFEIHEEFEWDRRRSRLMNRTRFVSPAGEEAATYSLRLYQPSELKDLLSTTGFRIKRTYGDFAGDRFRPAASDILLVHAYRPARTRRSYYVDSHLRSRA